MIGTVWKNKHVRIQPGEMSPERYVELVTQTGRELSPQEYARGWHYCAEWDWLLVEPGTPEMTACRCERFDF